jgi:hypothetical protein
MLVRLLVLSHASCALLACAEPHYDDEIGVEGVVTDRGSLTGTFALKSQALDQANTILGPVDTGGVTYSLVVRTLSAEVSTGLEGGVAGASLYDERIEVCDVENFETAGLTTVNTPDTVAAIPEVLAVLEVDHGTGFFLRHTYREYWAVQGLDEDDPLPTDKTSSVFYDMDADGNPGTTLTTSGLVDGEVYVAQRKTVDQEGVVQGTDESLGLSRVKKEGTVLGASNDLLLNETERVPHPDPKASWFFEVRLDDGAGCDAVVAAKINEDLPRRRPF